jgi:hypothetical protein
LIEFGSNEPAIAAGFDGDSVIEVLTGFHARIVRLPLPSLISGNERFLLKATDSVRVLSGLRTSDGWILALQDGYRRVNVRRFNDRGESTQLARFRREEYASSLPDSLANLVIHLTADSHQLLVSSLWQPYTTQRFSTHGLPLGELPAIAGDSIWQSLRDSSQLPLLVGLPAYPLGSGYLQVLSDLTSDTRILVAFHGGRPRYLRIRAPMGILAVHPTRNLLVASRQTPEIELVTYECRWSDTPTSKEEGTQ